MNTERVQVINFFTDNQGLIREKNRTLLVELVDGMLQADYESVKEGCRLINPTKYSIQGFLESLDLDGKIKGKLYDAGYAAALLDVARLYGEQSDKFAEIESIKTGYKEAILSILYERGTLLHKELAQELGISPSNLNAKIKLVNASSVQLVKVDGESKYKWYSLTPIAYKYMKEKKNFSGAPEVHRKEVTEASLSCYKACATLRVMEKKDLEKTKKMLEEVYQKAVLRFSPEIVDSYAEYGFETCEAFTNFLNEFKSVCEFIADRNFYYDSIINALKENMHVSRELCEFLAGLLDANMEKMQMILLLHRLHQVKS